MTSRRLPLLLAVTASLLFTATPSRADFDAWLKGVMNAPGFHAGKHYREPRKKKVRQVRQAKQVDPMKALRHQMVSGKELSEKQLGQLVKSGDELAAFKLAQKIEAVGDPDRLPSAMGYYVTAVEGGRDFAAASVVKLLDQGVGGEDAELIERSRTVLEAEAVEQDHVRSALIRMYKSGKPFGPDAGRSDALLVTAAETGDAQAALDLAYATLADPARHEETRKWLAIAAAAEDLAIRTQAENLLRSLEPGAIPAFTVAWEMN